jgi:HPt (histidine-containing phosphotransfer) domain-containing protein
MLDLTKETISKERCNPLVASLIPGFLSDRELELAEITQSIRSDDLYKIQVLTHNWKGYCPSYGFNGLGELAIQLDKAIQLRDKFLIRKIILQMEDYLRIKKEILYLN